MSPYERMAQKYADNPQEHTFDWYCDWHKRHAYLFSTPEYFIMGRPLSKTMIEVSGPLLIEWGDMPGANCYYVHAAAGDLSKAWSILPRELPYLAFERLRDGKLELQILPLSRIRRLTEITST